MRFTPALGLAVAIAAAPACGLELSGFAAFEGRSFPSGDGAAGQASESLSAALQPELYHDWDDGDQSFRLTAFVRYDPGDDERTHADVRELYWQRAARSWELAVGVRKVFWGVTESAHLVDVVNQTDLVEDPDGEQKLGQAMVQLSLIRPWGTVDLFLLPGFRERTYPGPDGRLGIGRRVDTDRARYESAAGEDHVDWAVRWSRSLGPVDLGLSHFSGTGREPQLIGSTVQDPATAPDEPPLVPFYEQVDQSGLDLQVTLGAWLWKLEAISRTSRLESFLAALGGFEYTFFDVRGSGIDVGVLTEVLHDQRANRPGTAFVGSRLTFNDVQSTEFLVGAILSEDTGSLWNLEASRRLGSSWQLAVRARAFTGVSEQSPLRGLREDDYLQVEISKFF